MASPSMTLNQSVIATTGVGAGATVSATFNGTTKFQTRFQITCVFGSVSGNGVTVTTIAAVNSTTQPTFDTIAVTPLAITPVTNTTVTQSWVAPIGMWKVIVNNGDAANPVTSTVICATVDAIA